jgi:two-component system, NtrC family, sensor kinase
MSINTKIAAAISLLVTALLLLVAVGAYQYLALTFKETVWRQQASVLTLTARHVDDEVLRSQEILALIARGIDPERLHDGTTLRRSLRDIKSVRAFFNGGLQIIDSNGRIVAETPAPAAPRPAEKGPGFVALALAGGKPFISAPYLSSPDQHPLISFSVPIPGRDGSVAGLLVGSHDLYQGNGLAAFGHTRFGTKGRLFIMERNRTIIMHPEPRYIMKQLPPGEDGAVDDAIQRNRLSHAEATDRSNERVLTSAMPIANANWLVVIRCPKHEAYRPLRQARLFMLVMLPVALVLSQCVIWFLIRRITQPLLRLTSHVRTMHDKEGNDRLIILPTGDELEDLALAMNAMVGEMDQKQQILMENRELYRIIASFTSELALLRTPDDSISYISANCLSLTGYRDREFLEEPRLLESIIHPEDRELWRQERNCGKGDAPGLPVDIRLITKKGELCWFKYSCHEVTGPSGEYLGMRGSFRDISLDRVYENMLEEQRHFAESLLENTSTPLFVIDKNHRVIIWNKAVAELTGIPAAEMIGSDRHWEPFYAEPRPILCDLVMDGATEEMSRLYGSLERNVVMQGMVRADGWYSNLNGKERYLFLDAAPVLRGGEMVAVVETLYDLTERARAEESLRLFSQAVEQSASTIVITDRSGLIQYVNRKFSETTGYSKEEVLGRDPSFLKSGSEPAELYRSLWETISSGREWHGEFYNRRKDGTFFWESALISPIADASGTVTHFLGVKEDISSRKADERKLMKKQAELVVKHEELTCLYRQVEQAKREWELTMDCIDAIVVLVDGNRRIRRFNRALVDFTGSPPPRHRLRGLLRPVPPRRARGRGAGGGERRTVPRSESALVLLEHLPVRRAARRGDHAARSDRDQVGLGRADRSLRRVEGDPFAAAAAGEDGLHRPTRRRGRPRDQQPDRLYFEQSGDHGEVPGAAGAVPRAAVGRGGADRTGAAAAGAGQGAAEAQSRLHPQRRQKPSGGIAGRVGTGAQHRPEPEELLPRRRHQPQLRRHQRLPGEHRHHRLERAQVQGDLDPRLRGAAAGQVPAAAVEPGLPEHAGQRSARHRDTGGDHRQHQERRGSGPGLLSRHRLRHSRGDPEPDLRALLHHQGGRKRNRARALDKLRHHQEAQRQHRGGERPGLRHHLHHQAAG